MPNQPPCIVWAEKLAVRYEDLSSADQAALDTHVKTCTACQAAQADYHFLDARLRALPPPAIKPFPRACFCQTLLLQKGQTRTGTPDLHTDFPTLAASRCPWVHFR